MLDLTTYLIAAPIVLAIAAMLTLIGIEWAYAFRGALRSSLDSGNSLPRAIVRAAIDPAVAFHRAGVARVRYAEIRRENAINASAQRHPSNHRTRAHQQVAVGGDQSPAARPRLSLVHSRR